MQLNKMVSQVLYCLVVFAALLLNDVTGKLREGDCEVCVKFLTKFDATLSDEVRGNQEKLTNALKKTCGKAKNKEQKFCFYVGGVAESATYILKEITKPLGFFKPPSAICEALKKKDAQICDLAYEKPLDWKNINLKKMRVKELKKILSDWEEGCKGCVEKSDFIKKIESVKSKYVEHTEL